MTAGNNVIKITALTALKGKKINIKAKAGSNGKLFGSVTAANIADAISEQIGVKVDKKKVVLAADIKNFGSYNAVIKLYNGISEKIDIEVDGMAYHLDRNGCRKSDDIHRDVQVSYAGWKVIRFWHYEVINDVASCVNRVRQVINEFKRLQT